MRSEFLPFARPDIDDTELSLIKEALDAGWITSGPMTKRFEAEFAACVGAKHAVAVNSCTAAMHLALEAIGLKRGDEVITSPYTFAATAEVIRYFDAKPILVDIHPENFNINPELIEPAISEHTKAIIPVHIAGLAADLGAIARIARRYNLAIVEDAAHSFPTRYKGSLVGSGEYREGTPKSVDHIDTRPGSSLLAATCFSFYATKTLTTGEGGMLVTNSDAIADRCRIMSLHGISRDAWKRYTAEGSWYYEILAPGFKYNMTDIAASMGLAQLAKAERMAKRRTEIAESYDRAFSQLPELQIPSDPDRGTSKALTEESQPRQHAWHLYMLRLNLELLSIDRAAFIELLKASKIGVSVHFIPLHIHPYYRDTYCYNPTDFPHAYREYQREISLPIYSKMTDQDVEDVISAVRAITIENRR